MTGRAEKIRWRIAYLIDRLTKQCWSDLVEWAIDGRRGGPGRPPFPSTSCQAEGRIGSCYCGKFRQTDQTSGIPDSRDEP